MQMNRSNFLRRLLALFVIAGLFVAPLAVPTAAGVMGDVATAAMTADMPCCPHMPMLPDCQKCPTMAVCMSQCLLGVPAATLSVRMPSTPVQTTVPQSEFLEAGLDQPPPARPPRTSVNPA